LTRKFRSLPQLGQVKFTYRSFAKDHMKWS